ncbi:c-type cytochrome [Haloplanus aerogenes]|uniref:Thiosulfate dehydrogenase n=1 Tax=Haloplanus aerogenes TaxID=660522 RepID=A0A3M0DRY9_9EURY|nr:c-type cytochrome [Haloplanus aerogenes]RMB18163.1 thiosulfate dehydrogenase [Haloplanus aerogenes]
MSQGDSTLLLKPALLLAGTVFAAIILVFALNGVLAYLGTGAVGPAGPQAGGAGATGATATPQGADTGGGGTAAAEGSVQKLPGDWSGSKWYNEDLREQEFKYKDPKAGSEVQFQPKKMNNSTLPENENRRELVREGRKLFANTSNEMPEHVGNDLSCANCHGGGSLPTTTGMVGQDIDMIPLVGTAAGYPEWTGRTQRMRDMRQRIMGCFLRSMNAPGSEEGVPAYDSREIQAMESYMVWLNKGTPSERVPYWRHIEKPEGDEKVPVSEVNPVRGAELYLENCASCHGANGQGVEGQYPPLWGEDSFNDGAGMGRMYTSAGFIRESMPYGAGHTFSNWEDVQDVAGFMNAHKRPHLPRQPKDWAVAGAPDEGIYYNRTQQRLGYDMNPMTKKLMLAGIPIDDSEVTQEMIPEDTSRYEQPLRNESVDGSWQTTWIRTYENVGNESASNATASNQSALEPQAAVSSAMRDGESAETRADTAG